jgi:hypothetical protein
LEKPARCDFEFICLAHPVFNRNQPGNRADIVG